MPVEESVNETITGTEPIQVMGGDSAVTFEELEGVQAQGKRAEQIDSKPKAEVTDKKKEKLSAEKSKDSEDKADDDESKEGEEKLDPKAAKGKADLSKSESKRTIKVKNGAEETELPTAAEIPVKINGQETNVKLEELISNYSGKKAWSDEFGKLGAEKQKFKQERDVVIGKLGEMFEAAKSDPMAGFMKMAEMAGMDPMAWRKDFLDALQPALEKRLEMSDAERRAADAEAEAAFYRSQTQKRQESERQDTEYKQFEAQVHSMLQQNGLSQTEFETGYHNLERAVSQGLFKPASGQITPDDVVRVVATEKVLDAAETALDALELGLDEQTKDKFYAEFIPMARDKKLSPDLIKAVVQETFRDHKASSLSKKIRKSQPERVAQAAPRVRNPGSEPVTFDDL